MRVVFGGGIAIKLPFDPSAAWVAAMTGADACANRLQSRLGSATRPTTAARMPLVSAV